MSETSSLGGLAVVGRIVVGTDLSHPASDAVDWAAARAERDHLHLLIILILPELPLPRRGHVFTAMREGDYLHTLRTRAEHRLTEEANRIRTSHPALRVDTVVLEGVAAEVLAEATRSATMVVVAARGEHVPLAVKALGGTADAVVTHAHGPVAVVTRPTRAPQGPVVVGVDDSAAARAALHFATAEAVLTSRSLRAIHAWHVGPWELHAAEIGGFDLSGVSEWVDAQVTDWLSEVQRQHPLLAIDRLVVHGTPGHVLVEQSSDASLVVVGSRGRGGFSALLLGSTSKEVLRRSECPVVVVRS